MEGIAMGTMTGFRLAADPRREVVDERFRSLGHELAGRTLAEVAAERLSLFGGAFASPVMVLRDSALEHNLRVMAGYCAEHGLWLAPHGKTTMAPQLAARQMAAGAWGMTAASVAQARVFRRYGIPRIVIANEVVDAAGVGWLAGELAGDGEVLCYVDSPDGVRLLDDGLRDAPGDRRLDVLVEVGVAGGRAGCRDVSAVLDVAHAVAASTRLRLVGVAAFEGILAPSHDPAETRRVSELLDLMRAVVVALADAGHLGDVPQVLVTAGGSAFVPEVVDALSGSWQVPNVQLVLRSGCYLTHDVGLYERLSPFGTLIPGPRLRPALELWAQVLSRPEPTLALANFGKRDVPVTEGLPTPFAIRTRSGKTEAADDIVVTGTNDQHGYLRLPAEHRLAVGDWVGLWISHPCLAFDRWQVLPVVDDDDRVVDLVRTFF